MFEPTWARYRRHLAFDLLLAAMFCGGMWILSGRPPGWDDFGFAFALLAVPTVLVSFGPAPAVGRFGPAVLEAEAGEAGRSDGQADVAGERVDAERGLRCRRRSAAGRLRAGCRWPGSRR